MVKIMENPYKKWDDLGGKHPLFSETSTWKFEVIKSSQPTFGKKTWKLQSGPQKSVFRRYGLVIYRLYLHLVVKKEQVSQKKKHMDVSENSGTPKSSILIWFSIRNHPFWGTPIFGNTHMLGHFFRGPITPYLVHLVPKKNLPVFFGYENQT